MCGAPSLDVETPRVVGKWQVTFGPCSGSWFSLLWCFQWLHGVEGFIGGGLLLPLQPGFIVGGRGKRFSSGALLHQAPQFMRFFFGRDRLLVFASWKLGFRCRWAGHQWRRRLAAWRGNNPVAAER